MKLTRSRTDVVNKAAELAVEYEAADGGCAQCTFLAIVDALRWGGAEIITPEVEDALYPGISLLTAGIGLTGQGSCGALTGSVMATGMAFAAMRGETGRDIKSFGDSCDMVRNVIMAHFDEKYRSLRCLDVQLGHFGKAWEFRRQDMTEEFLAITDGCVIKEIATLTVGAICDELERQQTR